MDKLDSLKSAHQAGDGLLCRLEEFIKEYADLINFRSVDEDALLGLTSRSATGEIAIPPVGLIMRGYGNNNESSHE